MGGRRPLRRHLQLLAPPPASAPTFSPLCGASGRNWGHEQAVAYVPIHFEGPPAEYLRVDWGEVHGFPFTQQFPATHYFLTCRLKYSGWVWVRSTNNMHQ